MKKTDRVYDYDFTFSRKRTVTFLDDKTSVKYLAVVKEFNYIDYNDKNYFEVCLEGDDFFIKIWMSTYVDPDHPFFDIFNDFIEEEEYAKNFNTREFEGIPILFSVKNIVQNTPNGEITRSFFKEVIRYEEEYDLSFKNIDSCEDVAADDEEVEEADSDKYDNVDQSSEEDVSWEDYEDDEE